MTITEHIAQFTDTTYVLDVPTAVEHTVTMATASNYNAYKIVPGRYQVHLTNLNGTSWNPDPTVPTPGYTANTGPYYAIATVEAIHTHRHVVDRLLTASRTQDTYPNKPTTCTLSTYAYLVSDGARGPVQGAIFRAL